MSPISEDASGASVMQDDRAHHSGSDCEEEGLADEEEDDEVESPEGIAPSKAEKLKQKLCKLRAMKNEHDVAGEQLSKDIQTVERLLLDAICNES